MEAISGQLCTNLAADAMQHCHKLQMAAVHSTVLPICIDTSIMQALLALKNSKDNTTTSLVSQKLLTSSGSELFQRFVRVVACGNNSCNSGHKLESFGSSTNNYLHLYTPATCAFGLLYAKLDVFFVWLEKLPK